MSSFKLQKLFFSGIGGVGMSAIASFMSEKGHKVFGSDRAFEGNPHHPAYKTLKAKGITIVPQDGTGLDNSFDLIVFSTAVEHNVPEYIKAHSLGIPIKTRPEYLAEIVCNFDTIAVAGTSGKSTTSGLLAFLMQRIGLDPSYIGGGRVKGFKTDSNPGNSLTGNSDFLVIEACESDGSIVNYKPKDSIILNLDLDHHSIEKTAGFFNVLVANTRGFTVINSDDNNLKMLDTSNEIAFSIDSESDYKAEDIRYKPFGTDFTLRGIRFSLSTPGKYNVYNTLAAISLLSGMGIHLKDISLLLPEWNGIERRFDIHLNQAGRLVIDDYAHNPHKIDNLMKTAMTLGKKTCYIFQPHGFAPTKLMKDGYIEAFSANLRKSDSLILLPIYYAGGTVRKDISSEDIAAGVKMNGKSALTVNERQEVFEEIKGFDTIIVLGARDETLSGFARAIADKLR